MGTNLVPRAFPLKCGWGGKRAFSCPTRFLREKVGEVEWALTYIAHIWQYPPEEFILHPVSPVFSSSIPEIHSKRQTAILVCDDYKRTTTLEVTRFVQKQIDPTTVCLWQIRQAARGDLSHVLWEDSLLHSNSGWSHAMFPTHTRIGSTSSRSLGVTQSFPLLAPSIVLQPY